MARNNDEIQNALALLVANHGIPAVIKALAIYCDDYGYIPISRRLKAIVEWQEGRR